MCVPVIGAHYVPFVLIAHSVSVSPLLSCTPLFKCNVILHWFLCRGQNTGSQPEYFAQGHRSWMDVCNHIRSKDGRWNVVGSIGWKQIQCAIFVRESFYELHNLCSSQLISSWNKTWITILIIRAEEGWIDCKWKVDCIWIVSALNQKVWSGFGVFSLFPKANL